jgi:chromosome partitioning protein
MQILPVINNKGGVGKTTTAVNVAAGLARRGHRVLLVDLDSQGSASVHLGVSSDNLRPSIADALFGRRSVEDVIRPTKIENLDLVTGSLDLANTDIRLKDVDGREKRLRQILEPVKDLYDQILIDCPPSTSIVTINALVAGDGFIVPVAPTYLALEGVVSLGKVVRRVRRDLEQAAPLLGIVMTGTGSESDESKSVTAEIRKHYGGKVFDAEIRYDNVLSEAPAHGDDVFAYAAGTRGASDYGRLVDEIKQRIEEYGSLYSEIAQKHIQRSTTAAGSFSMPPETLSAPNGTDEPEAQSRTSSGSFPGFGGTDRTPSRAPTGDSMPSAEATPVPSRQRQVF